MIESKSIPDKHYLNSASQIFQTLVNTKACSVTIQIKKFLPKHLMAWVKYKKKKSYCLLQKLRRCCILEFGCLWKNLWLKSGFPEWPHSELEDALKGRVQWVAPGQQRWPSKEILWSWSLPLALCFLEDKLCLALHVHPDVLLLRSRKAQARNSNLVNQV